MLYKRGQVWWYEFVFAGQRIRESSKSNNKELARRAKDARRRALENGANGLEEVGKPLLFMRALKAYLEDREPHWSAKTAERQRNSLVHLEAHFSKLLLTDIRGENISRYQKARLKEKASPRTVNIEVGLVRQVLRKHRLWANIQPDVRMLREAQDIGRALSPDEQHRLLAICKKSRSQSLYVAVLLSLHTGLRNAELRHLRWRQVDLLEKQITVGKSKTAGGEGRIVPLSQMAFAAIKEWRRRFPDAQPAHFVFPSEKYGFDGEEGFLNGKTIAYDVRPDVAMGSWKVAWSKAREDAGVSCRWHDLRHTFVSRMAEGQATETTITALAGWMSKKMMERYSHVRSEAKRKAISVLDTPQA